MLPYQNEWRSTRNSCKGREASNGMDLYAIRETIYSLRFTLHLNPVVFRMQLLEIAKRVNENRKDKESKSIQNIEAYTGYRGVRDGQE